MPTFDQLVSATAEQLDLTSTAAFARIGREVNDRYRRLCMSLGLEISCRSTKTASTVVDNRYVTFPNTIKIRSVFIAALNPPWVLGERTFNELRNLLPISDPCQTYAIARMGATDVTIFLDSVPATIYALTADIDEKTDTLSGSNVPSFPENYHDILVYGAKAEELRKMEKLDLASNADAFYEGRLAELRYFIAKTAYLDIYQNKTGRNGNWASLVPLV